MQHEFFQAFAEGIGLENWAFHSLHAMFVWQKLKHFVNSLNSYWNTLDPEEHRKEHC